ncbi:HNH endonuclease [Kroppenstedtia eburnea]|uniref:HNH endonuclease n=1 Tax=Kroppenstedtia eburnea TaxID=714067 RepID=UPI00362BEB24
MFSDSKDDPNIEQTLNVDVIGNGGFGGPRGGGPRGAGGHIDNGGGYGYRGDGGNGTAKSGGKGGSKSSISKETAQLAEKHGIKLNGFRLKVRTKRNDKGEIEKWVKTNKGEEKKLRNGHLAGKNHPETGVPFTKNGFPKFDKWSKGETRLPKDYYLKSDAQQFKYASRRLWDKIKNNEKAKSKFTKKQLEALKNGEERIPGLTWHHHQQQGKMQLVESNVHKATGHTGGRDIWGGGKEFRK